MVEHQGYEQKHFYGRKVLPTVYIVYMAVMIHNENQYKIVSRDTNSGCL